MANPNSPKLNPLKHQAVILLSEGHTITETARLLGLTRQGVQKWARKDPAFKEAVEKAKELRRRPQAEMDPVALLDELTEKAVETLEDIMMLGTDKERLAAALAILDRSPRVGPPVQRTENRNFNATARDLERVKKLEGTKLARQLEPAAEAEPQQPQPNGYPQLPAGSPDGRSGDAGPTSHSDGSLP